MSQTGAVNPVSYTQAKADFDRQNARLKKATQDFEGVFIGQMLKQMRKSMAGANPLFGNSSEAKLYQEMQDDATAENMSKTGSFGLGHLLYKTMKHTLPPDPEAMLRSALTLTPQGEKK